MKAIPGAIAGTLLPAIVLLLPTLAAAQSAGTLNLTGPLLRPSQVNQGVNTLLSGKVDTKNGSLSSPTIVGGKASGIALDATSTFAGVSASTLANELATLAQLQASGAANGSTLVTAAGAPDARTLSTRFADTINAADYGVAASNPDNTAAVLSVCEAVNASPGAQVDWPAGQLAVASQITCTLTKNALFRGRGGQATHFYFTSNASNGFHFYGNDGADIEWEESGIDTAATTPTADALLIEGYNASNGVLPHNNIGRVIVDHNQVEGAFFAGVHVRNANFPEVDSNWITISYKPIVTSALPSPNNLTADPASFVIGSSASAAAGTSVGTAAIFLEGSGGDFLIDPKVNGNSLVDGFSGIESDNSQGGYMTANSIYNSTYGVRAICGSGYSCENFTFTAGYVYAALDDFYLHGMDGYQITSNFMWLSGPAASGSVYPAGGTVGVFVRGGDGGTVSGNTIQEPSSHTFQRWGWFVGNDSSESYPWVMGPNSLLAFGTILIGNDANTRNVQAQGNSIAQSVQPTSGTSIVDPTMTSGNPFGNNNYAFNSTPYPDVITDGQGDLKFRRNIQCGDQYNSCSITQQANGQTVFSTSVQGAMRLGGGITSNTAQPLYRAWSGTAGGYVPAGATMILTPSGTVYPAPASTAISDTTAADLASGSMTLMLASAANYAAGMGVEDVTKSPAVTGTIGSVTGSTLALSTGLSGAVANGDTIQPTYPMEGMLGEGQTDMIGATSGDGFVTVTDLHGYALPGGTEFDVGLRQSFIDYAPGQIDAIDETQGTVPSTVVVSIARDSYNGEPYLLVNNGSATGLYFNGRVSVEISP